MTTAARLTAPLALLLAGAGGAIAQPAVAPPPRPAPPGAEIRRLQAEALAARREQVELLLKAVRKRECRDFEGAAAVVRRLADAEAAADDPAAGVAWCEKWASALRGHEEWVRGVMGPSGDNWMPEYMAARAARVEAEVELLRRREAAGLGPPADPAGRLTLHRERVKLLSLRMKLLGGLTDPDATYGEYLALKAARLDAEVELARLEAGEKTGGK